VTLVSAPRPYGSCSASCWSVGVRGR
jgi:hypothetical protein